MLFASRILIEVCPVAGRVSSGFIDDDSDDTLGSKAAEKRAICERVQRHPHIHIQNNILDYGKKKLNLPCVDSTEEYTCLQEPTEMFPVKIDKQQKH